MRDFASMVRPMTELTKKGKHFLWTVTCQKSFEQLKKALVSSDVIGCPLNDAEEFILDVDTSDIGIGVILNQVQEVCLFVWCLTTHQTLWVIKIRRY